MNDRQEKDETIIGIYEQLTVLLSTKIENLSLLETTKESSLDRLELFRNKEELLRHEESLKSKRVAVENLQQRADEWEVQFEGNSRIVNENFENAVHAGMKVDDQGTMRFHNETVKLLLDGYVQNKSDILSNQQAKNNLYFQLVEQLNTKKR